MRASDRSKFRQRLANALKAPQHLLVLLAALAVIGSYCTCSVRRLLYPFDLEWMEGGMLDHVAQLAAGRPLYAEPTAEFTAFIYNPLYFWLGHGLSQWVGLELSCLRLISVLCTWAIVGLIYFAARRERSSRVFSLAAAALFLGAYPTCSGWFDLARVDMLYTALALGAFVGARYLRAPWAVAVVPALAVLSFLSKQVGVSVVVLAAAAVAVHHGWGRGAVTLLLAAGATVLGVYWLSTSSDGWYEYYAFELPAAHGRGPLERGLAYFRFEVAYVMPLALLATLWAVRHPRRQWQRTAWVVCLLACFFPTSFASRVHDGGSLNTWIPLWAALSLIAAVSGAGELLGSSSPSRVEPTQHSAPQCPPWCSWVLSAALVAQLAWMASHFRSVDLPSKRWRQHAEAFLQQVDEMPGKVWVMHHGGLTARLGKPHFAHAMALVDVFKTRADVRGQKAKLHRRILESCRKQRFNRVISSAERRLPFFPALKRCLPKHRKLRSKFAARVVPRGALSPNQLLWR